MGVRWLSPKVAAFFLLFLTALITGANAEESNVADTVEIADSTEITREVVEAWYNSASSPEETEKAFSLYLDENVTWINIQPVQGVSDVLPWIGTFHGPDEVKGYMAVYMSLINVTDFKLLNMIVQGDQAASVVHEAGVVKSTGLSFETNVTCLFQVDPSSRKIIRWEAFWDPSQIIAAFLGGPENTTSNVTAEMASDGLNKTEITRQIVEKLYANFSENAAEFEERAVILDDNIEWTVIQVNPFRVSYTEGDNETLPWIGTFHGKDELVEAGIKFWNYVDRSDQHLLKLYVHEDQAIGIVREEGVITKTGRPFTTDVVTWLQLDTSKGKIIRWITIYSASELLPELQVQSESEGIPESEGIGN